MSETSLDDLGSQLLGLQLIDLPQLQASRDELPIGASTSDLLYKLEQKHALTKFQLDRILKGDADGLVLGGVKLMYRNASGSFARVYRGCSVKDGSMVGVKVLRERWSNDRETIELFQREGEIGQRLKHPNIVPIYGYDRHKDIHFITMEFVEGGNLRDFLKIRGKLDPIEACRYAMHICEALAYAYGLGITHRDMKMTNVLMSSQGTAKLIDFGLAAEDRLLQKVGHAAFAQALEYSTLEKHTRAPVNDPRSDLFFLGGILYELVTGQPPYPRTRSRDERRDITRYREVQPVGDVDPTLPPGVINVVTRLMEIDPDRRYASAQQVLGDLRPMVGRRDIESGSIPVFSQDGEAALTVLCVEGRRQQQDWLRDYLSRHGYRVLLLSDVERALQRMKSNPPHCVIFMGGSIGNRIIDDFERAVPLAETASIATVFVLSERQASFVNEFQSTSELVRVLTQPIRLRDLREAVSSAIDGRAIEDG
ncbi:MAG: protein kinase [Planctomycetaceae bacterium]|nr:protein kinase [Planctomycetaceae bacterium]